MRLLHLLGAVSASAVSLGLITSANAAPLDDPNLVFSGTYVDMYLKNFPTGLNNEQSVFLADSTGTTITGNVGSQNGTPIINFSSTTDTLVGSQGNANITAVDNLINNITITAPGYWFDDLIFSVNLTPNDNQDLSITGTDKSGGTDTYAGWVTSAPGWVNGENNILVLSTSGNLMQSVTINSNTGIQTLGGLASLKNISISGLTAVPVPPASWLFGSGLLGIAAVARRKMSS